MASLTANNVRSNAQRRVMDKTPSPPPPSSDYDPFPNVFDASNKVMPSRRASPTATLVPMGKHSGHVPMGKHSAHDASAYSPSPLLPYMGQPAMPKFPSTRAIMTPHPAMGEQTPLPKRAAPTYGRSHSLIGFDPLATPSTVASSNASPFISYPPSPAPPLEAPHSAPPIKRASVPLAAFTNGSFHGTLVCPPTPNRKSRSRISMGTREKDKALTPKPKSSTDTSNKHRRDIQSFCTADLRSISSEAAEQENLESCLEDIFMISSSSNMDIGDSKVAVTAPKPKRAQPPKEKGAAVTPITTETNTRRSTTPKKDTGNPRKDNGTPKSVTKQKDEKNDTPPPPNSTTPRKRVLPWPKKSHRRISSLENKELAKVATASTNSRSSLPNTPTSEKRSSMYPAMIQDLMELSFNQLQMPSLAKPSPTSFLTGKEDEVVRTCELDPSPHQMEIPKLREFVVAARLNEFVENYRRVDQNFDLQQWVGMNRMDLRQVKIPQHQPIVQSLLECGDDVCLQGVISKGGSADEKTEVVIFEGQRQFTAVFRGTTEQQCKPGAMIKAKKNGKGVAEPLDPEHGNVEVYSFYREEYGKLEAETFALLDKLTEQNPFCDVCFTGHSFGATMATLAAFRYSNARPMMRVSCITLASPKVGFSAFKQLVNSSPNLKVMRLEFGQDGKCQLPSLGGYHVGHTLVLHGSLGHNSLKTNKPVLAYKFDAPKYKKFKTAHPDLRSYVNALEEVARLGLPWAKDFVGTSGQGVVINNEARQVV